MSKYFNMSHINEKICTMITFLTGADSDNFYTDPDPAFRFDTALDRCLDFSILKKYYFAATTNPSKKVKKKRFIDNCILI